MRIWRNDIRAEQLNDQQHDSMPQYLGVVFTEVGDNFLRGTMPVDAHTCMPFGTIHGGASVVLAETLGSVAANLLVDLSRQSCVGQEINASHIRPAPLGTIVTGTARPIHLGRRSQVWGIDIVGANGELVCISRLTMAVLDRPPPGEALRS